MTPTTSNSLDPDAAPADTRPNPGPAPARRFLFVTTIAVAVGLCGTALFTLLVDPFGAWPRIALPSLAPYRDYGSRTGRAELLWSQPWRTVIVGSSRSEIGLTPSRVPGPAVNLSLSGTNMLEAAAVANAAMERPSVERVILSIDFLMFDDGRAFGDDFEQSRFQQPDGLKYRLELALSLRAVDAARGTLRARARGAIGHTETGQLMKDGATMTDGQRAVVERVLREFLTSPERYARYTLAGDRLAALASVIALARERQVTLDIVIAPVHALQLEAIRVAGLWETFHSWKAQVAALVPQGDDDVHLFDFTGYHGPLAEVIPATGDVTSRMQFFLETSHFTPLLGDMVLDDLERATRQLPLRLGHAFDATTVAEARDRFERARAEYARNFPDDIAWITSLAGDYP